jgi:hypothetical protein
VYCQCAAEDQWEDYFFASNPPDYKKEPVFLPRNQGSRHLLFIPSIITAKVGEFL